MNVMDQIEATQERNRQGYEFLADLTGQTVAEVEADLTAPDPGRGRRRPDECLICEFHEVTLALGIFDLGIFELKPSVPIHWCTEMWIAWPKLRRFISDGIPTVPDWCSLDGGREA